MTTADYLNQLETDRQDLVDNLETKGITGLSGDETFTELVPEVLNIPSGSSKLFNGEYDSVGLTTIGWTTDDISYYNENGVQWNSDCNNEYKLNASELAGDNTTTTRFLPKNTSVRAFSGYNSLIALPLIDTSSLTSGLYLFQNCYQLTTIPLLDTSNITNFNLMFQTCYSLTTIPLIDTSNGVRFANMFNNCFSLKTIPLLDLTGVNHANGITGMFNNCYSLETIPLLDTKNVGNFNSMFYNCYSLKYVPILDLSSATDLQNMFSGCRSLKSLDNVLQMCIGATSYTGTKTLAHLGFTNGFFPASRIQALPSYQDFIESGWTIGY